jgi:arylsulfatase A-like enzyme
MIAQLDDAVGRILDALDEAGIADETLVVFTSDNGGATYTGATGNDPLKGGKMSHFEGGLAVPFAVRWPGAFPSGTVADTPVIHTDIFATVLNAASVLPPPDRNLDGRDLRSFLGEDAPDRDLFWRADYNHIVRSGRWKLLRNGYDGSLRLYDLEEDREERRNLAEDRPDIVKELEELFDAWNRDMRPPAWPRVMNYRFEENGEVYWFAI